MKGQPMKDQQMKEKSKCGTFTEANFQDEVINNEKPVLAIFEANWSGTCDIMTPIMESLCLEFEDRIIIGFVDVDRSRKLAEEYRVNTIPALFFFNHGEIVEHLTGLMPKRAIVDKINNIIS
jgi:thioredoxin 1